MPQTTDQNPTPSVPTLYVAFELAKKEWKIGFSDGGNVRVRTIHAGDIRALFDETRGAREHLGLPDASRIVACYEAGRDGFWLQRLLANQDWKAVVIDPASIEVSRKHRRAKTDRLDVKSMNRLLVRWDGGEGCALSIVQVISVEEEDARRRSRELKRLTSERSQHSNRVKSLLTLHGIELAEGRISSKLSIEEMRQWDGSPLPERFASEIERELERLALVEEHISGLESERRGELKEADSKAANQVLTLMSLKGIGEKTAWSLVQELFCYREFSNRRELASFVGLDPVPWMSGQMEQSPGISKSGNRRLRASLIEAAWSWVRHQPASALTLWFRERFGVGKRSRRVGIVAVARKLLIALWRLVKDGLVPEGAALKA